MWTSKPINVTESARENHKPCSTGTAGDSRQEKSETQQSCVRGETATEGKKNSKGHRKSDVMLNVSNTAQTMEKTKKAHTIKAALGARV